MVEAGTYQDWLEMGSRGAWRQDAPAFGTSGHLSRKEWDWILGAGTPEPAARRRDDSAHRHGVGVNGDPTSSSSSSSSSSMPGEARYEGNFRKSHARETWDSILLAPSTGPSRGALSQGSLSLYDFYSFMTFAM